MGLFGNKKPTKEELEQAEHERLRREELNRILNCRRKVRSWRGDYSYYVHNEHKWSDNWNVFCLKCGLDAEEYQKAYDEYYK